MFTFVTTLKQRGDSQSKEEFLVDARDAGGDAEYQDASSQPHMDGFEELAH